MTAQQWNDSGWKNVVEHWPEVLLDFAKAEAREAKLVEALEVACRLMGHADIDWPESIDAALATVKEDHMDGTRETDAGGNRV